MSRSTLYILLHFVFFCLFKYLCHPINNAPTLLLILYHTSSQVHVKSESLAIKISQEINYAKSLYYEQQLMLPASENEDCLLLEA